MRGRQLGTFVGCSKALLACLLDRPLVDADATSSQKSRTSPADLSECSQEACRLTCGANPSKIHLRCLGRKHTFSRAAPSRLVK
ncbi:hypothetical protein PF010_g13180 [Phytophthora fragariae]|uniref:Secreted protein n=1 Tax=Phytophthora fragariae TaxID=53985 RepID=A0A6A3KLA8_9STRA|nr:hypothetical protein PF003_g38652 [Phytophthora fragariae]KAE8935260.1 hypothetical protein PF009_g14787 [Phytophthora fragariae]KAE9007662.1 hypothetical protein PF011_g11031 [Phytophthora fragariae]KAE9104963.1 hypothetical protein PF007_g13867 [Phytophthora fragariae]KAE9105014.1 hypothetical protein PF010_g13180 [Phytophthora fragariae]